MIDPGRDAGRFLLESWLDFGDAIERNPELRSRLFDSVTGLPTAPLLFPRIESLLEERGEVSLLCVSVARYARIEEIHGRMAFDEIMLGIAEVLDEIAGETLRDSDVVAELMNSGSAFVVVLSPPRTTDRIDPFARVRLANRIENILAEKLAERLEPALLAKFGCFVGSATVSSDEGVATERLVYDGLEQALASGRARVRTGVRERGARLRAILAGGEITTLFHPVFSLESMEVVGYEALSRGPMGSEFERPDKLFAIAYGSDLVMRLERVCRKKALDAAQSMPAERLLFVNIEPEAVGDPQLRDAVSDSTGGINPARVVLELGERTAASDFGAFRSALDYVRALGFSIALDEAGAGIATMQCIGDVRPQWLKIDLGLVRGCDGDEVKASMIRTLVALARSSGSEANVVAVGIETEAELETLRDLGVTHGQGHLLAPPGPDFPASEALPARRFV